METTSYTCIESPQLIETGISCSGLPARVVVHPPVPLHLPSCTKSGKKYKPVRKYETSEDIIRNKELTPWSRTSLNETEQVIVATYGDVDWNTRRGDHLGRGYHRSSLINTDRLLNRGGFLDGGGFLY